MTTKQGLVINEQNVLIKQLRSELDSVRRSQQGE